VILFFAAQNNRVVEALEHQLSDFKVARCRSFNTLEKRLRKPRHGLAIALMVVDDFSELTRIEEIQSLMRDLRLLLVLPSRDARMVSHAHRLAPRFIAYADHGCDQIGAVIKKMTGASKPAALNTKMALMEN